MELKTKHELPWAEIARGSQNLKTGEWRYQRPVTRPGKCRQCGQCYLFCPTGCVVEKATSFAADLEYCKGCGICATVCPVNAIVIVKER